MIASYQAILFLAFEIFLYRAHLPRYFGPVLDPGQAQYGVCSKGIHCEVQRVQSESFVDFDMDSDVLR